MFSHCRPRNYLQSPRGAARSLVSSLLVCFLLVGCERENRSARPPQPEQLQINDVMQTDFFAGSSSNPAPDPKREAYTSNAYYLSQGQKLYQWFNCNGCHANGGGDIGPPHIDDQWRYGSSIEQIYASIVQGRPNGMPSYRGKISEEQLWQLAGYVKSMSGNVRRDAAPSRPDQMSTQEPPNAIDKAPPVNATDTGPVQGNAP